MAQYLKDPKVKLRANVLRPLVSNFLKGKIVASQLDRYVNWFVKELILQDIKDVEVNEMLGVMWGRWVIIFYLI